VTPGGPRASESVYSEMASSVYSDVDSEATVVPRSTRLLMLPPPKKEMFGIRFLGVVVAAMVQLGALYVVVGMI